MENEQVTEYVQARTPDIMRLGECVLKAKGVNRKMSQFAEECGVGASTLSRIANGKIKKPLSEEVIRAIYAHRDKECTFSLNEFMLANGLIPKEVNEQKNNYSNSHQWRREEAINKERKIRNTIITALVDRNIPVINASKLARMGRINALYGLTVFYDFSFYIEDARPQNWCFDVILNNIDDKMPLSIYKKRMMDRAAKIFLIDAWDPVSLNNIKYSFVFCDRRLYEALIDQFRNAPIRAAMSAILIDIDNESVVEETWISKSPEISSVLSRPVQPVEDPEMEKMIFTPDDYMEFQSKYWRKPNE